MDHCTAFSILNTMAQHEVIDWSGAFIAYCRNIPNEEICATYLIAESRLQKRITAERWPAKRSLLMELFMEQAGTLITEDQIEKSEAQLAQVLANRDKNFQQANQLRHAAQQVLDNLIKYWLSPSEGESYDEKYDEARDRSLEVQGDIATALTRIAKAMGVAQELTYRALGDLKPAEAGFNSKDGNSGAGQINIIMPAAIAQPRQERSANARLVNAN
jgi:hypothetical protein